MVDDSIEDIRKKDIADIKEKIKKNPKYLHPCNKERQEDIKRLTFESGYEFTCWMQQNGILKSPMAVRDKYYQEKGYKNRQDYEDQAAKKLGFENNADRYRENNRKYRYEIRGHTPMSENEKCAGYFGIHIAEELFQRFLTTIFEYVKHMDNCNRGFDFICKNPKQEFIDKYPQFKLEKNKEYKIQLISKCLRHDKMGWDFRINHNEMAEYFILSAWDDRDNLGLIHVWIFHKNEMIRLREFWNRDNFSVNNSPKILKKFGKYEFRDELDRLKELCTELEKYI